MGAATNTSGAMSPSETSALAPELDAEAGLFVEALNASRLAPIVPAWLELIDRALEPNPFLHPAFALPLMQHLMAGSRLEVLAIWGGATPRLVGLFPLTLPRAPWGGLARGFAHEQVCLGTPLLDRNRAAAVFDALLDWLGRERPRVAGLLLSEIPVQSALVQQIIHGRQWPASIEIVETRHRAVLRARDGEVASDGNVLSLASAKRRKERKRQMRRLAERGARSYASARSSAEVARACELFLALEARGWKGRRGSALLAEPARATFARTMLRGMADAGLCRIDALETEGRAIAMGVVLTDGATAFFWKTAFDQEFASLSPGVQFTLALTEAQLGASGVTVTDSCAVPDHPMINRLWPERMAVCDLVLAPAPSGASPSLAAALGVERLRRRLRRRAKASWSWLRRVRPTSAKTVTKH